jgi:peptidoglycan hydrolase CwlO-like protein
MPGKVFGNGYLESSEFGVAHVQKGEICSLNSEICSLNSEICSLNSEICSLNSEICSLNSVILECREDS